MTLSLLRTDKEITSIYERNVKTVYRVCFTYMKNIVDTEEAVAETFFNMVKSRASFESLEHEKAWLIRVATNVCKNTLKHWWRKNKPLEDNTQLKCEGINIDSTLEVVLDLPNKYKTVVYLYYYENYTAKEIARILHKPSSTIRNHLHEARNILKNKLGGQFNE